MIHVCYILTSTKWIAAMVSSVFYLLGIFNPAQARGAFAFVPIWLVSIIHLLFKIDFYHLFIKISLSNILILRKRKWYNERPQVRSRLHLPWPLVLRITKVNVRMVKFDSLFVSPHHLFKFYFHALLDSLRDSGWSVFIVKINLVSSSEGQRSPSF